jgi:Domain of unknown function (DUF305)
MYQPSCRRVVAALSGKLSRHGLGVAVLGARLLVAFVLPSHVLAHENRTTAPPAAAVAEAPFYKENEAAMSKMMAAMDVKPTGDIDRDFVAMMTPHHQGAIDMAIIQLRYGKNETLRRLAQEIIVDQMQEIDAMKLAIGETVSASAPAPTQVTTTPPAAEHHHMLDIHMDMSAGSSK